MGQIRSTRGRGDTKARGRGDRALKDGACIGVFPRARCRTVVPCAALSGARSAGPGGARSPSSCARRTQGATDIARFRSGPACASSSSSRETASRTTARAPCRSPSGRWPRSGRGTPRSRWVAGPDRSSTRADHPRSSVRAAGRTPPRDPPGRARCRPGSRTRRYAATGKRSRTARLEPVRSPDQGGDLVVQAVPPAA